MKEAKLCLIAAVAENRVIGKDNKLLWHLPSDLKRFKKVTSGHPVIMGLKTYESLGKPLSDRTNIVLFPEKGKKIEGCVVCNSIEEAIKTAKEKDNEEIFIIGGGMVYAQTIGLADKLYLTVIEGEYEADTFFPDYSEFGKVVFEKFEEADGYKYRFLELER